MSASTKGLRPSFRIEPPGAQPLVEEALTAAGWAAAPAEDSGWTLLWTEGEPEAGVLARLGAQQRVNHIPGSSVLTRKDQLSRTLRRARRILCRCGVGVAEFHPETYLLPDEFPAFAWHAAAEPGARWIQKPRAAARGEGVTLVGDVDDLETGSNWLVQRYLDRPHLIEGRKYTLRWYALVTSLDPLTVYVFEDFFAKLASRPYSLRPEAVSDRLRHLTNPDVQAANPEVPVSRDNLTRPAYQALLEGEGHDPGELFRQIETLIAATLAAGRDEMARATRQATNHEGGCFELFGLDFLVEEELRPWLLECNRGPSLAVEADGGDRAALEERQLKEALVGEVLRVVGLVDVPPPPGPRLRPLLPDPDDMARLLPLPRPSDGAPGRALRRAAGVTTIAFGDGLVLHDAVAGEAFVLEPLSAYLWTAWNEGMPVAEIAAELAAAMPEEAGRAERDVWNALGEWVELGLLEPAPDPPGAPPPAPKTAGRGRIAWNRQRAYHLLDTVLTVGVPSDEVDAWLQLVLAPMEDDRAEVAHTHFEVTASRGGWELVGEGARIPVRSLRQVGALLRDVLFRHAFGTSRTPALAGTVLDDEAAGRLLVLGPPDLRAQFARGWVRDGGACVGDEVVLLEGDGLISGRRTGFEIDHNTNWWGPLPTVGEADPVHLSADGRFARMWVPKATEAPAATPARILAVEWPTTTYALFTPMPMAQTTAFRTLLGSLPPQCKVTAQLVRASIELAGSRPAFSAQLPDPEIGRKAIAVLPPLD